MHIWETATDRWHNLTWGFKRDAADMYITTTVFARFILKLQHCGKYPTVYQTDFVNDNANHQCVQWLAIDILVAKRLTPISYFFSIKSRYVSEALYAQDTGLLFIQGANKENYYMQLIMYSFLGRQDYLLFSYRQMRYCPYVCGRSVMQTKTPSLNAPCYEAQHVCHVVSNSMG